LIKAHCNIYLFLSFLKLLQMMETTNPFSVTVYNDLLYWSDTRRRTIQRADKITGKNRKVLLKRPGQPFGLKASIRGPNLNEY
jgi:hypothetical protein